MLVLLFTMLACGCPETYFWTCWALDSGASTTHAEECTSLCSTEGQVVEWCESEDECHEFTCEKQMGECR